MIRLAFAGYTAVWLSWQQPAAVPAAGCTDREVGQQLQLLKPTPMNCCSLLISVLSALSTHRW